MIDNFRKLRFLILAAAFCDSFFGSVWQKPEAISAAAQRIINPGLDEFGDKDSGSGGYLGDSSVNQPETSSAPGKLSPVLRPIRTPPQSRIESGTKGIWVSMPLYSIGGPKVEVDLVESAVLAGDSAALTLSLKEAYEKMGGDATKFELFGNELAGRLLKHGIVVTPGKRGMSIHKNGLPDAVEYQMDGNVDLKTGKVIASIKAQAYDWVTKKSIFKSPELVTKELGNLKRQ